MDQRTTAQLDEALDHIRAAPADAGILAAIVRRPEVDGRERLDVGELSLDEGLVGDTWRIRGSRRTTDGGPHPDMQLNVMSARVAAAVAGDDPDRWALAGDQLFVDLDLSETSLPPGTRLALGGATIEITAQPHRGCAKFGARFGEDARRWVNRDDLAHLHLRGVNARVVVPGTIRVGDPVVVEARPTIY